MPDWTLIIDKDQNRYYIDKNSRIWTSGVPEFNYKAVSIDGLDFYLKQGLELVRSHYKVHALTLLKSIMAMPLRNNRIYKAQCKATEMINYMIKNEGDRFSGINDSASIILYKDKDNTILINDKIHYSIQIPNIFNIIHRRIREKNRYYYYGILLGFNLKNKDVSMKHGYRGYDLLLAIDSEMLVGSNKSVKRIEKIWRKKLRADTFERVLINKSDNMIIYSYKDTFPPYFSGFEGYFIKGRFSHCLRLICGQDVYLKNQSRIRNIIESYKL